MFPLPLSNYGSIGMRTSDDGASFEPEPLIYYSDALLLGDQMCSNAQFQSLGPPLPSPQSRSLSDVSAHYFYPASTNKRKAAMGGMQVTSPVTGICSWDWDWDWQCQAAASDAGMLSAITSGPPERVGALVAETRKMKSLDNDVSEAAPTDPPQAKPPLRSQKLGEKVRDLRQLVSPFGKTDTTSVLQEAAVQIRLLHERIRVLTMPYFDCTPFSAQCGGNDKFDLQSRGLCLVPISSASSLGSLEMRDTALLEGVAFPRSSINSSRSGVSFRM